MSAVVNILRFAVAFIDSIIVWLIKMIYGLFFQLTDIMLYSEDIVQGLGQRIGLILGIFMLFRLAVSLVTYLISPDKLNDNAKGGGKMLVNIIISLVLLATVNIIFVQAYKIQDVVIRSKFIEKIFFGSKAEVADTDISYYLYTPLFSPNEEAFNNLCADLWDPTTKIEDDEACDSKLYEILGDDRRAVYQAFNSQDMSIVLGNYNVVTAKSNGVYAFDYKYISPIAGIVCAIVLISFSMDLAVRAVKLLFLQIISPIPIISNIDPGKGQDMFKKWYQECFKTYISVFIRMITIDFAVFLITILLTNFKELFTSEPLLNVSLIVGALMFAKQVPKLIEDMFGIKLDGMALNPLKKIQEQALFGKNITGLAAGTAGGLIGGVSGFATGIASRRPAAAIGAALFQPLKGAVGGLTGGKGLGETWKNQRSSNATMRTGILNGSTFGGRIHTRISNALGTGGTAGRLEVEKHRIQDQIDDIDQQIKAQEDLKAQIKGTQAYRDRQHQMQQQQALSSAAAKMKERAVSQVRNGEGNAGQIYNNMKQQAEALKHLQFDKDNHGNLIPVNYNGHTYNSAADAAAAAEAMLQQAEHYAENEGWRNYASQVSNGGHNDATFTSMQLKFDDAHQDVFGNVIDHADVDYGDRLNGALGASKGAITRLEVAGSQDERQIAAYDRAISDLSGQKQPLNDQMRDISRRESHVNADKNAVGGK